MFHLENCLAFRAPSPCSRLRRGWGRQKAGREVPGLGAACLPGAQVLKLAAAVTWVRSEPLPQVGMKGEASGSLAASPIGDPCHDSWALGWSRSARPYGVCGAALPAPDAGVHPKGPRDPWAQPTASRELFLKAEHAQLGTWRSPLHLWGLGPLCALPEPSQSTQQLLVGL